MNSEALTSDLQWYTLHLADTHLILGQRLGEWCGHGPILEQDIALTNIGLDLLGQATTLYQSAATLLADGRTEDDLAFLRHEHAYYNVLLVEQPNGDFGTTVARQFYFDAFQHLFLKGLVNSHDPVLAGMAEKALKEATYHLKWSSEWVIRLGDGTDESHDRMQRAMDDLWMYTAELTTPVDVEKRLAAAGYIPDLAAMREPWLAHVRQVAAEATLSLQAADAWMQQGGKEGRHTEHLGFILTEMQYMQRTYPGMKW